MERKRVKSSNIEAIGYDEESGTLEVAFKAGTIYQYLNVPNNIYNSLMSASSHGKYLNDHIKDHYRFVQIR